MRDLILSASRSCQITKSLTHTQNTITKTQILQNYYDSWYEHDVPGHDTQTLQQDLSTVYIVVLNVVLGVAMHLYYSLTQVTIPTSNSKYTCLKQLMV